MNMKRWMAAILTAVTLAGTTVPAFAVSGGGSFKKYTFDDTPKSVSTDTDEATIGERNALRVGEDYLNTMGFSYEGLIEQLEYEGFSHDEAVYACDILFENNDLPLEKGSKGEAVKEIQQRLSELGFLNGSVDGIFGSGTEKAVKSFQTHRGMEATGIVDATTYDALFAEPDKEDTAYSFVGKISLKMNMDSATLWKSSKSAAFGAVVVMADIAAEKIDGVAFEGITNVYLAKITFQEEGEILAYYYFRENTVICAIFNPEDCKITVTQMEYTDTPKNAMLTLAQNNVINDYQIVNMEYITEILDELN